MRPAAARGAPWPRAAADAAAAGTTMTSPTGGDGGGGVTECWCCCVGVAADAVEAPRGEAVAAVVVVPAPCAGDAARG